MDSTLKIAKSVVVGNDKIEFPRLQIFDLYSVTDGLKAEEEQMAKKLAAEMKVGNYELFNVVHAIRSRKPTVAEVLASCDAPQGAVEVLNKSLDKKGIKGDEAKAMIGKLGIPQCIELSRELVLDIQDEEQSAAPLTETSADASSSTSTTNG